VNRVVRWSLAVTLVCAAVAVYALPFRTRVRFREESEAAERWRAESTRLREARRQLDDAVREHRARESLERWRSADGGRRAPFVLDASLPGAVRQQAESIALAATQPVAGGAGGRPAALFVFQARDTLRFTSRYREPTPNVGEVYGLPEATGGEACVSLVNVRNPSAAALARLSLGPCTFFARFGKPGPGIRAWLDRVGFSVARFGDQPPVATQTPGTPSSIYDLSPSASACLTRGGRWCLMAAGVRLADTARGVAGRSAAGGFVRFDRPEAGSSFGPRRGRYLADLLRDIGPDRFRAFWTSAEEPEAAFRAATGRPLADWTREWLGREVRPTATEARASLATVGWLALALPLLLAAAARRREWVLPARLRG
jgi:hypothetical protein